MVTHILFESGLWLCYLRGQAARCSRVVKQGMVNLLSFSPFKTAAHALENANDISEGILNETLQSLLELNLSKPNKKSKVVLGVWDPPLASSIKAALGFQCDTDETTKDLIPDDLTRPNSVSDTPTPLSLFSTSSTRTVNLFSMRIREWYGYHFPELVKIVPDNYQYAKAAQFIGAKETLNEEKLHDLAALLDDDSTRIHGSALNEIDMLNIMAFATRVVSIAEYRKSLMALPHGEDEPRRPSLTALLGERLVPASTLRVLCRFWVRRRRCFRALKTKGNTPKYGLIYHSSFIGRAGPKHKGRISRFLANKCSIASRIDCFSEKPTAAFGEALKQQVEERLNFFETGEPPHKNADAIRKDDDHKMDAEPALPLLEPSPKKDKKKKRKAADSDDDEEEVPKKKVKLSKEEKKALKKEEKKKRKEVEAVVGGEEEAEGKKDKKDKKDKKEKKERRKRRRKRRAWSRRVVRARLC
ncbi:hypothetical protein BC629DRAFT_1529941 [Irpex lacteus]|nr:hypothetical protein BC629DRAFT_1529941 [Irpex lacteus]